MKIQLRDRRIEVALVIVVILSMVAAVIWAGVCHDARNPPPPCPTTAYSAGDEEIVDFHCVGQEFAQWLQTYLASHPDLEVEAISGDGTGTHGRNTGFWVVFKRSPSAEGYRQGL